MTHPLSKDRPLSPKITTLIIAAVFLLVVAGIVERGIVPIYVLWLYLGMSVITVMVYGKDKRAAKKEAQRTPESTLHMLSLLGGWPGALFAQQLFRHKTSKRSFRIEFWFTLALNIAALLYLASEYGTWATERLESYGAWGEKLLKDLIAEALQFITSTLP